MIFILNKGGRLGNILFQAAAAISLSKEVILCDVEGDKKEYFEQFKDNILRKVKLFEGYPKCNNSFTQSSFRYEKIPFLGQDLSISGSFQSEKYFDEKAVRELFKIDEKTKMFISEYYGQLFNEEITGIHVRRGDYLKFPHKWIFCGLRYYRDAICYIGTDKRYLMCSDDIAWCKRKFKGKNYFFAENTSPIVDLYLQANCTNNIMSNSTFSWWGAWLNENPNKVVIAPKRWFGIGLELDTQDLIPKSYVIIDNQNYFTRYIYGSYKIGEERVMATLQQSFLRPYLRVLRKFFLEKVLVIASGLSCR